MWWQSLVWSLVRDTQLSLRDIPAHLLSTLYLNRAARDPQGVINIWLLSSCKKWRTFGYVFSVSWGRCVLTICYSHHPALGKTEQNVDYINNRLIIENWQPFPMLVSQTLTQNHTCLHHPGYGTDVPQTEWTLMKLILIKPTWKDKKSNMNRNFTVNQERWQNCHPQKNYF